MRKSGEPRLPTRGGAARPLARPSRRGGRRLSAAFALVAASLVHASPSPADVTVAFVGDQGVGESAQAVLQLVADREVDLLMALGDLGYDPNTAERWIDNVERALGTDIPVLAVVGNHENEDWPLYRRWLDERAARVPELLCDGETGVMAHCRFRGVSFVQLAPGITEVEGVLPDADYAGYLERELADEPNRWRVCSWHKNQRDMQTGDKGDATGWGVYRACREAGGIVATAHEHAYSRTHLLSDFERRTVVHTNDHLELDSGRSFAFVSGLGGQTIRPQTRGGDWWAAVYSSTQDAVHGALFCTFGETRGACRFEDVAGGVADSFTLETASGAPPEPDLGASLGSGGGGASGAALAFGLLGCALGRRRARAARDGGRSRARPRPVRRPRPNAGRLVLLLGVAVAATLPSDDVRADDVTVAFVGDQGTDRPARDVLGLIASEGTDLLLVQGDLGYDDGPESWIRNVEEILGEGFPVLAVVGNHEDDGGGWPAYRRWLAERIDAVDDLVCEGRIGVKARCTFRGISVVQVAPGIDEIDGVAPDDGYADYIAGALANDTDAWRICSWHKLMRDMQIGDKSDETGWGVYERCREAGGIVATAHAHSYSRTYLMSHFERHEVVHRSDVLEIGPGRSFAFVSGLGGQRTRPRTRRGGDWWAATYSVAEGGTYGALFCTFGERRAECRFKDIAGGVADRFTLQRVEADGEGDPEPDPVVEPPPAVSPPAPVENPPAPPADPEPDPVPEPPAPAESPPAPVESLPAPVENPPARPADPEPDPVPEPPAPAESPPAPVESPPAPSDDASGDPEPDPVIEPPAPVESPPAPPDGAPDGSEPEPADEPPLAPVDVTPGSPGSGSVDEPEAPTGPPPAPSDDASGDAAPGPIVEPSVPIETPPASPDGVPDTGADAPVDVPVVGERPVGASDETTEPGSSGGAVVDGGSAARSSGGAIGWLVLCGMLACRTLRTHRR